MTDWSLKSGHVLNNMPQFTIPQFLQNPLLLLPCCSCDNTNHNQDVFCIIVFNRSHCHLISMTLRPWTFNGQCSFINNQIRSECLPGRSFSSTSTPFLYIPSVIVIHLSQFGSARLLHK